MERRLAAFLAADVVGYSKLMELDETGTHARMQEWDESLVVPVVARHGGRIVKRMGDGFLVEFPSAVVAVACAVDWQDAMAQWRETEGHENPLRIRIGLHLGDIISRADDIFGNGVNIAARLESLSPPDGICLSEDIYRHITQVPGWRYTNLGAKDLKNIQATLSVWSLTKETGSERMPAWKMPRRTRRLVMNLAVAVSLVASLAKVVDVIETRSEPEISVVKPVLTTTKKTVSVAATDAGDARALVILPLEVFGKSDEDELDGHADGFVEDLTTDLAQSADFTVISRRSAFKFEDEDYEITQIAKILDVDYLIEGSFRLVGDKIRINIQFIDGIDGSHEWAVREDVTVHDLDDFRINIEDQIVRFMIFPKPAVVDDTPEIVAPEKLEEDV